MLRAFRCRYSAHLIRLVLSSVGTPPQANTAMYPQARRFLLANEVLYLRDCESLAWAVDVALVHGADHPFDR